MTEAQLAELRVGEEGSVEGLQGLTLTRWLDDPEVAPGPELDGVATEQVTGGADAIAILNDVIGLSDQFGAREHGITRLEGDAARRRAARAARRCGFRPTCG